MIHVAQQRLLVGFVVIALFVFPGTTMVPAQQLDTASVVHQVDAAVTARIENLAGYTVTEHYAVYRGEDEIHPTAEMTVMTTYKKESGKSYVIISQTGSSIVRKRVLLQPRFNTWM
jgi:hypothetical protein